MDTIAGEVRAVTSHPTDAGGRLVLRSVRVVGEADAPCVALEHDTPVLVTGDVAALTGAARLRLTLEVIE